MCQLRGFSKSGLALSRRMPPLQEKITPSSERRLLSECMAFRWHPEAVCDTHRCGPARVPTSCHKGLSVRYTVNTAARCKRLRMG